MRQDTEQAFLLMLNGYKAIIYKISHAYAVTREDRKDLFQEIVVSLWKAYPSFKSEAKISTWIYRVALYTAITNYRHRKKQAKYEHLQTDQFDILMDTVYTEQQEDLRLLYSAIEKLPPVDKAVILLLLGENSYAEISQVLGITPAAAAMRIKRAKDKLANFLTTLKHA